MLAFPSPAKINLFLRIINKNSYGYYNLQTLFQLINYGDILYFQLNNHNNINIYPNIKNLKLKDNLIFKAAELIIKIAKSLNLIPNNLGLFVFINKYIPLGSGLGGGSSNAATVFLVLNKLFKMNFSLQRLSKIGLKIGADIPFFIYGHTAFAEGIGEKLKFINLPKKWYLIVNPGICISTKYIFQKIKLKNNKTKNDSNIIKYPFKNDFEKLVRKEFFYFEKYISFLSKYSKFRMTGTGSCIFAEFDTKKEAYKIFNQLPSCIKSFITEGLNTSPLHSVLNNYLS